MKSKTFKPKYRGVVMFDLDGVLADFEGAFCEAFGEDNRHLYSLEQRYPEQADTVSEWCQEPENYANLSPIFGGVVWMNQVIGQGFYTAICTSRPANLLGITLDWLDKYNIRPHDIFIDVLKWSLMQDLATDMGIPMTLFVDDSVDQLAKMKVENPQVTCVAWSQPWNVGWMPRAFYSPKTYKVMINT